MSRRTAFGLSALLAACGLLTGAVYSWTIAIGVVWFGASFMILILVTNSLKTDMTLRLGESKDGRDETPTPGATH